MGGRSSGGQPEHRAGRYAFYAFTADGGQSWSASTIPDVTAELHGVVALSPINVWAVGQSGTIVHYNGSWETKKVSGWPTAKAFRAIAFLGSTGWAVGDGYGVAITTDNGDTWSTLVPPGTTGALRAVAAAGSGAYAVGDTGTGSGSAIMKYLTTAGSSPWSAGTGSALYGIAFADASNGWAVGANATFVRTTNGGGTWTSSMEPPIPLLPDSLLSANGLRSIAFFDAAHGVAVGMYQGVWRTSDGGHSWSVEAIDDGGLGDYELRGAAFVPGSADHPIVVGRALGITLTKDSEKARAYRGTWIGRVSACTLTYTAGTGGTISGTASQTVAYGGSGTAVSAVPATGYHFVAWSDGITTAARTDIGVTADQVFSATFALNTYTLTYTAGTGGTISGTVNQTVNYNGSGTLVTALANTSYHFVRWSDGILTAWRTDTNVTANRTIRATFGADLRPTSLSIVADHSSVRHGQRVYFHGVMKPNMPNGTHVGFYVRKSTSSTWHLISVRHTFSSHHWTYYYHPGAARGTYYIRVRFVGKSTFAACTSRTIKVIWR